MAGFIHDPLQIINLIADNLRDRYKSGFPVLKEIIQNADDAGSADEPIQLEFGLSQGLTSAEHPLLKGPALYFLNNGTFKDSDDKAIRSFGLNRKAIEQSAIGKFGLGMKSVFHFCEAFFFLAKNKDKEYVQILNPWSGGEDYTSFHDNWNNFVSSDAELIRRHVQHILDQIEIEQRGSFFLLWLPLRQKKHLLVNGNEVGSIISEFPGDNKQHLSFLFKQDIAQKIASLLPLLRRVNSIRFWNENSAPHFQVSMQGIRLIGLADGQRKTNDLEGSVYYGYNGSHGSAFSLIYSGREQLNDIPELRSLRQSPLWPKSYVRDDLGMSREAPDKAQGHSAVIFSRSNEKEKGRLKICWAVFLPVDAAKEELPCGGDSCYRLTLHGYFFIDAGRVGIEGFQEEDEVIHVDAEPQNEVELRKSWNIQLARRGTLPLIIPALEAFAAKARLSAEDIRHLSEGIKESKLFKRHQASICAISSWACCLTPKGKTWCVLSGEQEILPLPAPPLSAPERPWKAFFNLEAFQRRGIVLLDKDAPNLCARPLPQWNESSLLEILQFRENEVFADESCLDYLLQFMQDIVSPFHKINSLQERLIQLSSQSFIKLKAKLRKYKKRVQKFVSYILPENRFSLKTDAPLIIYELQKCKINVLILEKYFDSEESAGNAQLVLSDACTLLKKLHDLIILYELQNNQELINHCRNIAQEILLTQREEQRRALLLQAESLKILEGYDCLQEKTVALSLAELRERHESRLLFLYSQGINDVQRWGLASKLQNAIMGTLVLVNRKTADLVFQNNDVAPCHANSALDSLGTKCFPLRSIEARRQLLKDVAGADLDSEVRVRGMRYLLHGFEQHFDHEATLWVSGYNQSPVWGKLWQQLSSHHEDGWNLLERKLVEEIPANKWPKLSILEIKSDGILAELRNIGTVSIIREQFSQDERETVLRELIGDQELWKMLPFHETVGGELVSITAGRAFLDTGILLHEDLRNCADIIKRSKNPVIERQQKDWLTPLSKEAVIRIALQREKPESFWRLIMNNLDGATGLLTDTLLRDTPWLLDNDLAVVRPSDVVWLDKLQDEVDRLLAYARGSFWSPGKLLGDLQLHPLFKLLKESSFAIGSEGFEKLALLLGEVTEYHVGNVVYQGDDFDRIVRICARLPVHLGLPGWVLFSRAMETSQEMAKKYLLAEILKPIDHERIITILHWFSEEHSNVSKEAKNEVLIAFNAYLSALVNTGRGTVIIAKLSLLNREGNWKPATELCSEAEGVADSHLLDDDQKRILKHIIFHADRQQAIEDDKMPQKRELQPEISASADKLEGFFAQWEGLVPPEIICAFISLLGDDPKMLALAKRYQGSHSLEWIRDNIPWKIHHRTDELNRGEWMYGLDQHQALAKHRFIIRCSDGDMVQTCSILGEEIAVPLKSRFSSLITGGLFYEYPSGQKVHVRLSLRQPQVDDVSSAELSRFLKASAEYLLKKAYNQKDCDLTRLWEELDHSEQLDISIAQQLVLDHIPFYLRQLKVHKHPRLQELISQWDEARYKRVEYRGSRKKDQYETKAREVLERIQDLLKANEEVQSVVLHAVREKIQDFQYSLASIPYEIFQNADDAVVELAIIKAYPNTLEDMEDEILPDHVKRFIVIEQERSLLIAHWGRPVNSVGSADFPGRERGFHHDLEKMLVLSSSDKSEESKVTGKFGLGFKSVLLACERPRLLSGRLATEIIAGLSPVPLNESAQLRSKMHDLSPDRRWQGTLLELPLTDVTPHEIMMSFERLAGLMTIFSKQIRRIDIFRKNSEAWEWKPDLLPLHDRACLELAQLPFPDASQHKGIAVYFRLHGGGILFALGPDGFQSLPNELPAIWVVAPTKESEGLGFAVNCMFELDAGRSRLAGNSIVNKQKAKNLGAAFGISLQKLYELSLTQWGALKEDFRFERDLSVYNFWASLWSLIGEAVKSRGSTEVNTLVSHLFCGENGLGYLISNEDAMPNGLWDDYQVLTRPEKIRIVLKGILGSELIFRELVKWGYFRKFVGAPEGVMTDFVYTIALRIFPVLGQVTNQWRSLSLSDFFLYLAETDNKITTGTAGILGSVLNNYVLKHEYYEKERNLLEKALQFFTFKTQDGSYHSPDEVLVPYKHNSANPDEVRRAAFAPQEYVLSNEYQGSGLDFFFVCREKIGIPLEKMAQWLVEAKTDLRKANGLRYLLEGEHGEKVAKILRAQGLEGTWLIDLRPESAIFLGWEKQDVCEILFRILPSIHELERLHLEADEIPYELPEEELSRYEPQEILRKIHSWWMSTKETRLADYERRTYPEAIPFNLAEDDDGKIDRKSWLILFTLAHFHTIGRQKDIQHKGFIERCLSKGWWDIFSRENPEVRSDEWMGVLEDYINEQVDSSEYEIWMNRFPAIYKFSRWLEDYKEAFLSIERAQNLSSISGVLNPRVNENFQGGGFSAPPIEKSLGIGACFTLRELKRKRILNGSHAVPFCYVPVKRTLEFCEKIGCRDLSDNRGVDNSQVIHRFLCNYLGEQHAEFSNSYDVPLQIIAENEEVLWEILN